VLSHDDIAKLRRLMELRETRDRLDREYKEAKSAYTEAELELFEILNDGPVSRLNNVDLGSPWGKVSFGARETHYGRVIPGMEEQALEHYEQRAMIDQVTVPKFVMKRINEEVRDRLEQSLPMPPGIDYYARRGVTITRQKE